MEPKDYFNFGGRKAKPKADVEAFSLWQNMAKPSPQSLYLRDEFLMMRSTNGDPIVLYVLTPREYYRVMKGLPL